MAGKSLIVRVRPRWASSLSPVGPPSLPFGGIENVFYGNIMRFSEAPDAVTAIHILDRIATQKVACSPRAVDKPLALYGAGKLGKMAKEYFDRLGIPVQYVVDARPEVARADPFWSGTTILGFHEPRPQQQAADLLVVSLVSDPFAALHHSLSEAGWKDVVHFYNVTDAYQDRHPLGNGWYANDLSDSSAEIGKVLGRWGDDTSRAHHLQFIAWHRLREDWVFENAPSTGERYFIPEVCDRLGDQEVLLDIGAHHGEFTVRFLEIVKNRCQEVWAIEPDRNNVAHLYRNLAPVVGDTAASIHVLMTALGQTEGRAAFYEGLGYASQWSDLGQRHLERKTIDQLGVNPSFIKLHVEGWELDLLKGGVTTLQKCRPIIAATSYHNTLGLWQLPAWLMEQMLDYTFLLRLNS